MHLISEDGAQGLKHIYQNNMKSKGTLTVLRDINVKIIVEKKEDEIYMLKTRKIPSKSIEV